MVVHPLPESERQPATEALRRAVAGLLEGLREKRSKVDDPADLRARAVAAAYADGTEEGKLRHRYEMALDRSLRATIQQLIVLERSGADLAEEESQHEYTEEDTSCEPASPEGSPPAAPGSVGAAEFVPVPTPSETLVRGQGAAISAPARPGGGRSPR